MQLFSTPFLRLSVLLSALAASTLTAAYPRPQGFVGTGGTQSSYNSTSSNGTSSSNTTTYLQVPAVVTGSDGNSQFQCWQLKTPFTANSSSGSASQLSIGDVTGATYSVQPPDSNAGVHTTSTPALIHVISGLVTIGLPNNPFSNSWLLGGVSGSMIMADTSGSGHNMTYPSDESTVTLTLPFIGGALPQYTVVKTGVCITNLGAMGGKT